MLIFERKNAINRAIFSFFETMRKVFFLALISSFVLSSCIKSPTYSNIPAIKFVSVSSDIVKAFGRDTIIFSFTDGDGDIGTYASSTDSGNLCGLKQGDSSSLHNTNFNVFLIDSRDTCMNVLASADVEPSGKYKGISGEVVVITGIYSKKCFAPPSSNCPFDTVVFSIILKDKAGHLSNIVQTTPIVCDPH
ncbi:MAG: hypothetical protein JWO06_2666 [Bacteroidota bacterium]|nr:hypothetical protein [Bacteroidota bacterium]